MSEEKKEGRSGIISVISTPLQLAALIVLVVEGLLAFLLSKAKAENVSLYVILMVGVLVLTIVGIFIIENRRLKVIPATGKAEPTQKTYKWDVFLAAPMAALSDNDFESATNKIREIKKMLEEECNFQRIFFAGNNMKYKEDFEPAALSIEIDINELKDSQNFILIYPEKIVSSVLFEAGIALALGKPSFYFGKMENFPYLMQQANLQFDYVKIHEADSLDKIITKIQKFNTHLFKLEKVKF